MLSAGPLTVKHIEASGRQCIRQALTVEFIPGDATETTKVLAHGVPNEVHPLCFADGRIFVMNEAGATVADYRMD